MEEIKKLYLTYPAKIGTIAPEIYGHFTEHIGGVFYDGLWVGKNSKIPNIKGFRKEIIDKLRHIKAPVIRWPGGSFAEYYDWRDGIGKKRPVRLSFWTAFDKRYEPNDVGTHEFMDFCESVGAKAYFAANITSVSPLHMLHWMDYCLSPEGTTELAKERAKNGHSAPFNIPFWGVGNENWGDGGNMTPEFYCNEFRRLATVMKSTFKETEMYSCGQGGFDFEWTDGFMRSIRGKEHLMDGFAMHYYCGESGKVIGFTEDNWYELMEKAADIENIICRNWNIVCGYGLQKHAKLVVDEWGCWHPQGSGPSKGKNLFEQQSTMRDAVVTALTLNVFNNHCDKVRMANVAQLVNNLHALFLAGGEHCITTPTYHVFDMYKEHQGAEAIQIIVTNNSEFKSSVSVSASIKDGKTLVTIGNLSCDKDAKISLEAIGKNISGTAHIDVLNANEPDAHNTFEHPDTVAPRSYNADTSDIITVPKAGIVSIHF